MVKPYFFWPTALPLICVLVGLTCAPVFAQGQSNWTADLGATVTVTGTDNVNLTSDEKKSDVITSTQLNIGTSHQTPITTLQVSGNLAWDAYARETSLNDLRYDALALFSTERFDRRFSFDLSANTTEQSISQGGVQSATDRALDSNGVQNFNINTQPTFRSALGRWALAEASYTFSGAYYFDADTVDGAAPLSDTRIHRGNVTIRSGPRLSRLALTGSASLEESEASAVPTAAAQGSDRRDVQLRAEYSLRPRIRLTSDVGYEKITQSVAAGNIDDIFATAGFRWSPSSRTQVELSGGYRYEGPNFTGSVTYSYSELINVQVTYTESVETQQRLALGNLGNTAFDPSGAPVDIDTGAPADPSSNPFDLQDGVFRRDAVQASVSGARGRTQYLLGGTFEVRDQAGVETEQFGFNVSMSRQLSPFSTVSVSATYSDTSSPTGASAQTWNANGGYSYRISDTATLDFQYVYLDQASQLVDQYSENVIQLLLTKSF